MSSIDLRSLRISHEKSIKDLSQAVGISPLTLMRYEKGTTKPSQKMIDKIILALGINPDMLNY